MNNLFYIPINSVSLAHYFSRAIILPANYFNNKPKDIQDFFKNSILLSDKRWTDGTDCSIEVVLNEVEISSLTKLSTHFYTFSSAIPISRIKSVNFLSDEQKNITTWNINNSTAFLPERLVFVDTSIEKDNIEFDPFSSSFIDSNIDFTSKIKRYDILLGGFAFFKLGSKSFYNYTHDYISTFSYFNTQIREKIEKEVNNSDFKLNNKYWGLFSKNIKSEWSKYFEYIYSNFSIDDFKALADKENINFEHKFGLIELSSIDPNSHFYELAIIANYGLGKSKKVEDLVIDIFNLSILNSKISNSTLLFGLNYGYTKLNNFYSINKNKVDIKFRFDNIIDYIIIESLFQFSFNETRENDSFDYLNCVLPPPSTNKITENYSTYQLYGEQIIINRKSNLIDMFIEFIKPSVDSIFNKSKETPKPELLYELLKQKCEMFLPEYQNFIDSERSKAISKELNLIKEPELSKANDDEEQDLEKMNTNTLKEIAKKWRIKNYSKMKKIQLIEEIKKRKETRIL